MVGLNRIPDVAALCQVSDDKIWKAIKAGKIKAVRLGARQVRIPAEEVEKILREGF